MSLFLKGISYIWIWRILDAEASEFGVGIENDLVQLKCGSGPATAASPRNMLEMHTLGLPSLSAESDTVGVGGDRSPSEEIYWVIIIYIQIQKPLD